MHNLLHNFTAAPLIQVGNYHFAAFTSKPGAGSTADAGSPACHDTNFTLETHCLLWLFPVRSRRHERM
jgi:hypothetical protein